MEATQETPADVPTEAEVKVGRQETRPEADEEPRSSGEASVHLPDSSEGAEELPRDRGGIRGDLMERERERWRTSESNQSNHLSADLRSKLALLSWFCAFNEPGIAEMLLHRLYCKHLTPEAHPPALCLPSSPHQRARRPVRGRHQRHLHRPEVAST